MRLAVCAEMVFLDLPVNERVRRIAEGGFDAEIWDWTRHDIDALAATGATFSSMTGYIRGDFGDGAGELVRTAERSIAAADRLGCQRGRHGNLTGKIATPPLPALHDHALVCIYLRSCPRYSPPCPSANASVSPSPAASIPQ